MLAVPFCRIGALETLTARWAPVLPRGRATGHRRSIAVWPTGFGPGSFSGVPLDRRVQARGARSFRRGQLVRRLRLILPLSWFSHGSLRNSSSKVDAADVRSRARQLHEELPVSVRLCSSVRSVRGDTSGRSAVAAAHTRGASCPNCGAVIFNSLLGNIARSLLDITHASGGTNRVAGAPDRLSSAFRWFAIRPDVGRGTLCRYPSSSAHTTKE